MNSSKPRHNDGLPRWGAMGLLFVALAWTAQARASDPAGSVIDQEGKGVPGVVVSAIGRSWDQPESSAQAATDSAGRFRLPGAWRLGTQELSYVGLFARARDGRCGWVATVWRQQPDSADVTITLSEVGDVSGQLVDQDGKPISNTDVTVDSLDRFPGKTGQYDAIRLPAATAKLYSSEIGQGWPVRAPRDSQGRQGPGRRRRSRVRLAQGVLDFGQARDDHPRPATGLHQRSSQAPRHRYADGLGQNRTSPRAQVRPTQACSRLMSQEPSQPMPTVPS